MYFISFHTHTHTHTLARAHTEKERLPAVQAAKKRIYDVNMFKH